MYKIGKSFKYDSAHRIFNQNLKKFKKSIGLSNFEEKCKCLHGHTFKVIIELCSESLVDDMILDFNYLKFFKDHIDKYFDHKTVLFTKDPLLQFYIKYKDDLPEEIFNGITVVPFNPTVENMAEYFFSYISPILEHTDDINDIFLSKVKVYETETSYAEYMNETYFSSNIYSLKDYLLK